MVDHICRKTFMVDHERFVYIHEWEGQYINYSWLHTSFSDWVHFGI